MIPDVQSPQGTTPESLQADQNFRHQAGHHQDVAVDAAIEALGALGGPHRVELWTDSTYVRQGITAWVAKWKKNGWKTAARKPVKNQDLWEELDRLTAMHEVEWHWVKGHVGHDDNERADELAREGMAPFLNR